MPPPTTRHQDAVDRIAGWIVRSRFDEATALPNEFDIGDELGVSRTVVREAMRTLAAKGMVTVRPRLGTRVQPVERWNLFDPQVVAWRMEAGLSKDLVANLIDFRLAIEPFAADRAASRPDFPIAELEAAYAAMQDAAGTGLPFTEADLQFHATILRGTGNSYFEHLIPFVENALRLSFDLSIRNPDDAHQSLPVHRRVVEALAAHDGAGAREAMTQMIEQARDEILAAMPSDPGADR